MAGKVPVIDAIPRNVEVERYPWKSVGPGAKELAVGVDAVESPAFLQLLLQVVSQQTGGVSHDGVATRMARQNEPLNVRTLAPGNDQIEHLVQVGFDTFRFEISQPNTTSCFLLTSKEWNDQNDVPVCRVHALAQLVFATGRIGTKNILLDLRDVPAMEKQNDVGNGLPSVRLGKIDRCFRDTVVPLGEKSRTLERSIRGRIFGQFTGAQNFVPNEL